MTATNYPANATVASPVRGLRLSCNHLSRDERSKMGADMIAHGVIPTLKQAEAIAGVPASAINRHRSPRPKRKPSFTLAKAIAKATRDDALNAVEVLGEDFIFEKFFGVQA
jgi:hypothetical protein